MTTPLMTVTVEEAFDITGRGVAVAFRGSSAGLPFGVPIPARILKPDGTTAQAKAFVEMMLLRAPQTHERADLLLMGLSKRDAPPGSIVELGDPRAVEIHPAVNAEKVWTPAEIRHRYQEGERDFQGLDISDSDDRLSFQGAVLDGSDFSHAFVVADFTGGSLRDCKFVEANVKTCAFDNADLRGCDSSRAAIDAATFRSAQLERTDFSGAGAYGYSMKPGEVPTW